MEVVNILPVDNTLIHPKSKDSLFGSASYIPTLLNDMPRLSDENILPLNVVLIQISSRNQHGYYS